MMLVIPKSFRDAWKQASAVTKVRLLYTRVTLNRFTTVYFFLALANCAILVTLQGATLANNAEAVDLSENLLLQINGTHDSQLPVFVGQELQLCDGVPGQPEAHCYSIAKYIKHRDKRAAQRLGVRRRRSRVLQRDHDDDLDGTDSDDDESDDEDEPVLAGGPSSSVATLFSITPSPTATVSAPTVTRAPATTSAAVSTPPGSSRPFTSSGTSLATPSAVKTSALPQATSNSSSSSSQPAQAEAASSESTEVCSGIYVWFHGQAEDDRREDIATMFFHLWTLTLAVATILNESLPHLVATLAAHVLGTAWAGFRIYSGEKLKERFYGLSSIASCIPEGTFIAWWNMRRTYAAIIVSTSIIALLGTSYLSAKLHKAYASQTFSRVGASPQVHGIYKTVLLLSACLQLAWFFTLTSSGIWIDKVTHGTLMQLAKHCKLYLAAFVIVLILSFPWLILGWISVRKENRKLFAAFGLISLVLVIISSVMFSSMLYRYIFTSWAFFATVTVTAYIFTIATLVLGIICRLKFGKGLAHYLQVTDALEGMDFTPVYFPNDAEKASPRFPVESDGINNEKHPGEAHPDAIQQPALPYLSPKTAKTRGASIYTNSSGTPLKLSSTPSLFRDGQIRKSVASTVTSQGGFSGLGLDTDAVDAYSQLTRPPKSVSPTVTGRPRSRDLTLGYGTAPSLESLNSPFTSPADTSYTPFKNGLPSNPKAQSRA